MFVFVRSVRVFVAGILCCCSMIGQGLVAEDAQYRQRVSEVDNADAKSLLAMAMWCKQESYYQYYATWLNKTIEVDPEQALARRLLGYEKIDGTWLRGTELNKAKGMILHQGKWVTKEDYAKIEQGLHLFRGEWLTEEEYYKKRGFVKYLGNWISRTRYKRIESRKERFAKITRQRSQWSNAWEFSSRYFKVKTNTSHQVAREMAVAMDQCYEALGKVFGLRRLQTGTPLEIYATQEQFLQGSARAGIPVSPGVLGYFYFRGTDRGIRCFYAGDVNTTLKTLYHECTHLVVRDAIRRGTVPTWSNEGLAVYFEDARRTDDGFDLLTVPWHRLWSLRDQLRAAGDMISLNELVDLPQRAYSGLYYPRGWSLIYFLLFYDDGKYRKQFSRYYGLLTNRSGHMLHASNSELFRSVFGKNADDFYEEYLDFIKGLEPTTIDDKVGAALTAASSRLDFDKARGYAQSAIDDDPDDERGHLALGQVLLREGLMAHDPGQAADLFARAKAAMDKGIELGGLEEIKQRRGKSILPKVLMHIEWAKANIFAGDYELAGDILEGVLEVDDLSASAYKYLALLYGTAKDPAQRNLTIAYELLDTADDFGKNHESLWVRALLLHEEGKSAEAVGLLRTAMSQDSFGFGAGFYRKELSRIAPPPPPASAASSKNNKKNSGKKSKGKGKKGKGKAKGGKKGKNKKRPQR